MAEFPALPLFTDAYLRDCWHLSDAEHGRYFLIMMMIWQTPECRIPNDREWIARKLRRSPEKYDKEVKPLVDEFCQNDGNWITQKRLTKERDYLRKNSKAQSGRAKSRWDKEKDICPSDAERHQSGNAPTPTPTPIIEEKNNLTVVPKEKRATRLPADFEPDASCQAVAEELLLTAQQSQNEFLKFQDYWKAAPGTKGVKLDWQATFRNWLRNSSTKGTTNGKTTNGHRPGSISAGFAELDAAIAEARRREAGGSGGIGEAPPRRPS